MQRVTYLTYSMSTGLFFSDGLLFKATGRGRITERYVFLFDSLLILTKQNTKRSSVTGPVAEYKLKEKFNIRKIDVFDKEETEGKAGDNLIILFEDDFEVELDTGESKLAKELT